MKMVNWKLFGVGILAFVTLVGTVFFALDFQDKLVPKITYVSSTEYVSGDEGQTIIRLTDFKGAVMVLANCYDTILYPDKSILMENASMTTDVQTNYYHVFTVPSQDGVYETTVTCELGSKTYTSSKTFHVSLLSSQLQAKLSGLNSTINDLSAMQMQQIQNVSDDLKGELQDTMALVNSTSSSIADSISQFRSDVQGNFSFLFDLINVLNSSISQSEEQSHTEILSMLHLINETTIATQSEVSTFHSETNNQLSAMNVSIVEIRQDTQQIIQNIDSMNHSNNQQFSNLTSLVSALQTTVEQNHALTQENITQIKEMLTNISVSVDEKCSTLNQTIYNFWNETNIHYEMLYNLGNYSQFEINLILQYLNITVTDLNIYVSHNNCILGSTYIIDAQVTDYFNHVLTDSSVYCDISTNFWGNDTMSYVPSSGYFEYSHLCSPEGVVDWTIDCEWL